MKFHFELLEERVMLSGTLTVGAGQQFSTLQAAADAVQAGDTVVVQAGHYSGFDIIGDVSGTANAPIVFDFQAGADITSANSRTGDAIDIENCDYVTIEGATITNDGSIDRAGIRLAECDNSNILNNNVDGMGEWGVYTSHSSNTVIQGNTTSNSIEQHGIYVANSSSNVQILDNIVFGNANCGIHINGDASQGDSGIMTNITVAGNIIFDNGETGGSSINCDGVQDSVFENNVIYDNQNKGICLFQGDSSGASTNDVVMNNTIIVAGAPALEIVDGSTGATVFNNIFLGSEDIDSDSESGLKQSNNMTSGDQNSLFVDAANGNFQLALGSVAIDAGLASFNGTTAPSGNEGATPLISLPSSGDGSGGSSGSTGSGSSGSTGSTGDGSGSTGSTGSGSGSSGSTGGSGQGQGTGGDGSGSGSGSDSGSGSGTSTGSGGSSGGATGSSGDSGSGSSGTGSGSTGSTGTGGGSTGGTTTGGSSGGTSSGGGSSGGSSDGGSTGSGSTAGNTPPPIVIVGGDTNQARGFISQPLTISQDPRATMDSPTDTTIDLSVLAADASGLGVTYSWSASGAGTVIFSDNSSSTANNVTATVSAAGDYTFVVIASDANGSWGAGQLTLTVQQVTNDVLIAANSTTLTPNQSQQFAATAVDQFGNAMDPQPDIDWSMAGLGTVDDSGNYTAPPWCPGTGRLRRATGAVTATADGVSATATIVTIPATSTPSEWYQGLACSA